MSGGAYGPSSEAMSGEPDTDRGDPAMIGRAISGKFTIEKFLGGGAMGAVYKARFAALEKNVAVKVMHRAVAADAKFVGRFHREAKAASRLDHPNSIRVIDFGEEPDGLLYIAMEYVEGRDLYRVIHEDWPISNADIGDIMLQALAALAVAHEMSVIHRDLKPENLMMLRAKNDDGKEAYVVKVCDFGIAKITESDDEPKAAGPAGQKLTTQGLVVGTPEYMSPEQARGEKLDPRSDIYSMGIILYQLLTGRTPFSGDTALGVVLKHITEAPEAPSVHYAAVHKGLEAITLRAIAKDKSARFQTAREMRNAIKESLDGRPAPVDIAAATLAAPRPNMPGTAPMAITADSAPVAARGVTAPVPAAFAAPTLATAVSASRLTPLGTAAALPEPKAKSRAGLLVGVALVSIAVGGGLVATKVLSPAGRTVASDGPSAPVTPTAPTAPTAAPSGLAVVPPSTPTGEPSPPPGPTDPKLPKAPVVPTGHATAKAASEPAVAVAVAAPVVAPQVVAPPTPEPAPAPAPPPATPASPAAPAFNPMTCRAAAGPVRSNGATNAKDLTLRGTAEAWTACAQRSFRDKPSAPISASVHVTFKDNGNFLGASCATCPAQLAQCIASSTGRTAIYKNRSGDVTGDPAFDIPITVTCD